jgi:hypothetical protein
MRGLDRRQVLARFALTTAALLGRKAWPAEFENPLLRVVPGNLELREPTLTGRLLTDERAQLLLLFGHIGTRWEMSSTGVGEAQFSDLVDSKTGVQPSYLTEYKEGAALIAEATANLISLDALLAPRTDVLDMASTRLGRFQKYVSTEFIAWFVIRGGFRRFGYLDYRGYGGGPFTDHAHLPYRALGENRT